MSSSLLSELTGLAHHLDRLARLDRRSRDFTLVGIRRAIREVIANFPVYRSYIDGEVHDTDKAVVGRAVSRARKRNPMLGKPLFDFVRDTVLLKDSPSGPASDEYRALQRRFAGKFQQLTAPVTAKGIEDTAFYVFNRFVSVNEVGGEPARFGWPPDRAHKYLADRQVKTPGGLSPLSTHDTKRSEDVRARLNVLSELPGEWSDRVRRWAHLNRDHKTEGDEAVIPDANEEYLLYQTLVGAWPIPQTSPLAGEVATERRVGGSTVNLNPHSNPSPQGGREPVGEPEGLTSGAEFVARIQAYMKKALCEAKVHSSWINPDPDYEAAVAAFVDSILSPERSPEFLADLGQFAARVAFFGRLNSLAQTVVRGTAPGVPDTYQGTEAWDLSLVDPDNRRPVDYAARENWLRELDERATGNGRRLCRLALQLSRDLADPRAKLFATCRTLRCRRGHAELFAHGEYVPLPVEGAKANHVFAFLRRLGDAAAVVVVPRLAVGLVPQADRSPIGRRVWEDTVVQLPDDFSSAVWENVFTGERPTTNVGPVQVAEALGVFPVAVLVRQPA